MSLHQDGLKPLHWAANLNQGPIANMLLEKGADVNVVDEVSACAQACRLRCLEMSTRPRFVCLSVCMYKCTFVHMYVRSFCFYVCSYMLTI